MQFAHLRNPIRTKVCFHPHHLHQHPQRSKDGAEQSNRQHLCGHLPSPEEINFSEYLNTLYSSGVQDLCGADHRHRPQPRTGRGNGGEGNTQPAAKTVRTRGRGRGARVTDLGSEAGRGYTFPASPFPAISNTAHNVSSFLSG